MTAELDESLIKELVALAQQEGVDDMSSQCQWLNEEPSYQDGLNRGWVNGRISLARCILFKLGISYKKQIIDKDI